MTLKELRKKSRQMLRDGNIDSPEADADLILMHVLELNKTELLTKDFVVPDALSIEVGGYLNRRLSGTPVQYIIGRTEFMSLEFVVNKDVLIPRADTEILVEAVISKLKAVKGPTRVLDIGAGSGCIGLSIANELADASVAELDISEKALKVAMLNCERLSLKKRAEFICRDIAEVDAETEDWIPSGGYDCVVSNPPYIRTDDMLDLPKEIFEHEPISALDGGEDGLKFYRIITEKAPKLLKDGGILAYEVGYDQAESVAEIMRGGGFEDIETVKDLAGIDRVVIGFKSKKD